MPSIQPSCPTKPSIDHQGQNYWAFIFSSVLEKAGIFSDPTSGIMNCERKKNSTRPSLPYPNVKGGNTIPLYVVLLVRRTAEQFSGERVSEWIRNTANDEWCQSINREAYKCDIFSNEAATYFIPRGSAGIRCCTDSSSDGMTINNMGKKNG